MMLVRHHHVHGHVLLRGRDRGSDEGSAVCAACSGETIIGFPVPDAKTPAEASKAGTRRFIEAFSQRRSHYVPAVAPHAVYTNSDETLKAARALANRYNARW